MRAVNLIPSDQRKLRSGSAGGSGGGGVLGYAVIGVLALLVAAGAMYGITANKVSEREAEVAELEADEAAARTKAEALSSFSNFLARQQAREVTVVSLAQSRFDWERVMRELALVIPSDVWLVKIDGSISNPETGSSSPNGIVGPQLTIEGCANGHTLVGEFVQALEDVDGVTRVGVNSSERPTSQGQQTGAETDECRTRDFITKFDVTVAFDQVGVEGATTVPDVPEGALPPLAGAFEASQQASTNDGSNLNAGVVR